MAILTEAKVFLCFRYFSKTNACDDDDRTFRNKVGGR